MKTSNMIKSAAVLLFVLGGVQVASAEADASVILGPLAGNSADGVNGGHHSQTKGKLFGVDPNSASTGAGKLEVHKHK